MGLTTLAFCSSRRAILHEQSRHCVELTLVGILKHQTASERSMSQRTHSCSRDKRLNVQTPAAAQRARTISLSPAQLLAITKPPPSQHAGPSNAASAKRSAILAKTR